MSQYIQIISKLKPKNESDFKILDVSDIQININTDYNVLCANADHEFVASGINWDQSAHKCNIAGDLHIQGNIYQYSDRSLKTNIASIPDALSTVTFLDGVEFTWINTGKHDYGVIAQQMQKVIPQAVVVQEKTGYKQVNYIKLIPFLLQSIKQLNQRILQLEETICK